MMDETQLHSSDTVTCGKTWFDAVTPQFHGIVLHTDLLTFLLTYFSKIMSFKNISPHGEIFLI